MDKIYGSLSSSLMRMGLRMDSDNELEDGWRWKGRKVGRKALEKHM